MNAPFLKPWTQAQFFAWAAHQEGRWEFDGFRPVPMTGGTANHNLIAQNIMAALRQRLRGSGCRPFGPDVGIETIGAAVRYPDAFVTCPKFDGDALTIPGAVVVFEVLSPTSGRTDRIFKVQEYAAVPSVRRYVILESTGVGLQAFERTNADEQWKALTLTATTRSTCRNSALKSRSPNFIKTSISAPIPRRSQPNPDFPLQIPEQPAQYPRRQRRQRVHRHVGVG